MISRFLPKQNRPNKNCHGKAIALIFTLTLAWGAAWGQSAGDYRSRATGNWNNTATWRRYNGSDWVAATDYPGQNPGTGTVTIQDGDNVSLNVTPANSIGALKKIKNYIL